MKTNDYITALKELGFNTTKKENTLEIQYKEYCVVAQVSLENTCQVNILGFDKCPIEAYKVANFLTLTQEYIKTPTCLRGVIDEEKVDNKKYQLLLSVDYILKAQSYLNYCVREKAFMFDDGGNSNLYKTIFSDEEIKQFPDWILDLIKTGYIKKQEV